MRKVWFAPVCILAMLIFGLLVYNRLPAEVPAHWNVNGAVDRTMPRLQGVLLLPGLSALIWALRIALPALDPRRATYNEWEPTLRLFINTLVVFFGVVYVIALGNALGWNIGTGRGVAVAVGVLFTALGNEMGRVQPNWFFGIRTPWTLSNDQVWQRTHRLGGRIFFAGGIAIALLALVLPLPLMMYALLGIVCGTTATLFVYSYLLWRQLTSRMA